MSNVLVFPIRGKDDRDQITELKERLVEDGIFNNVSEIPTYLVIYIIQYWQGIYDAGYWEGLRKDKNEVFH
jgi:hypothetical protein